MYFALARSLGALTNPWVVAGGLLALAVLLRRRWRALAVVALVAAAYAALATPAVARALQAIAEASAHDTAGPGSYDVVVVLGGHDERVRGGLELFRDGRARHLLYTGFLLPPEIARLRARIAAAGIPDDRVVLETRSRNTHENAVESARIVEARGWRSVVLVTSAAHVSRAVSAFRGAGLDPDVHPVDFESQRRPAGWLPSRQGLATSRHALRELVGRAVYRLVGYGK